MKYILQSLALGSLITFASCEDKMDEKHKNPDGFTSTTIEYLFANGTRNAIEGTYGDYYTHVFRLLGTYTQNTARREGKDRINTYDVRDDKGRWENYYISRMSTLKEVDNIYETLTEKEKSDYKPYIQAGNVIKAYNTSMATDLFGSMPYSEAFTARNEWFGKPVIYRPKYDTQKDIYYSILNDLETARAYFKDAVIDKKIPAHNAFNAQDIVYAGDVKGWYKFANSLMLRFAMRISNVDEAKAKEVLAKIDMDNLILTNADNTCLKTKGQDYFTDGIWRAIKESHNKGNGYYCFAPEMMVNILKEANDPRLKIFFQPGSDDDGKVLAGQEKAEIIGYPSSADDAINLLAEKTTDEIMKTYAIYNTATFRNNYNLPLGIAITAAEVQFLLAEAAQRRLISGDAKTYYNKGVILSVQNYHTYYITTDGNIPSEKDPEIVGIDVTDAALTAWLEGSSFKFDASKAIEQIATQKWMHTGILQPFETYAEYRRLDYPVLVDDKENGLLLNKENMPKRFLYASKEASMNTENYNKVANENYVDVNLWWDVK